MSTLGTEETEVGREKPGLGGRGGQQLSPEPPARVVRRARPAASICCH